MSDTYDACKGFWNMCRCKKCRDADRELEQRMERAAPKDRRKIIDDNVQELKAARNIQ